MFDSALTHETAVADTTATKPADQLRRIALLRLTMLICLPLIIFTEPGAPIGEFLRDGLESVGILLVIAGVLGRVWSILYIGGHKNAVVMQDGPYSVCRHPLYLASTTAVLGFGLMLGSIILTVALTGAVFLILSDIAAKEER
ncbi:Phospholipid methyltransferase [Jannaschia faecimaris]|uniref:Phospholipid methyltransferase n=1 Tax=Jannaschia faecimaris TaxID=1244108 RepID=A0A1H3QUE6_9RHOB|nr:Phospholipid methyltransferase [Jannaschia faecimaris]